MINLVIEEGRLTADPVLSYSSNGNPFCHFKIAVSGYAKNETTTNFLCITAWKGTAVFLCNNFKKGQLVQILGSLKQSYRKTSESDNEQKYFLDIVAKKISFAPTNNPHSKNTEEKSSSPAIQNASPTPDTISPSEDKTTSTIPTTAAAEEPKTTEEQNSEPKTDNSANSDIDSLFNSLPDNNFPEGDFMDDIL
jgi:single-strand DNA-binding protein